MRSVYRKHLLFSVIIAVFTTFSFLLIRFPFPYSKTGFFIWDLTTNLEFIFSLIITRFKILISMLLILVPSIVVLYFYFLFPKISEIRIVWISRILLILTRIIAIIIFLLSFFSNLFAELQLLMIFIFTVIIFLNISISPLIRIKSQKLLNHSMFSYITFQIYAIVIFGSLMYLYLSSSPYFFGKFISDFQKITKLNYLKKQLIYRTPSYIPSNIVGKYEELENNTIADVFSCKRNSFFTIRQTPIKLSAKSLETVKYEYKKYGYELYRDPLEITIGSYSGFYDGSTLYFQTPDSFIEISDNTDEFNLSCIPNEEIQKVASSLLIDSTSTTLLSKVSKKPYTYQPILQTNPTFTPTPPYVLKLIPIHWPDSAEPTITPTNSLTITLNKTKYQSREPIYFTIQNGINKTIYLYDCNFIPVEKIEDGIPTIFERNISLKSISGYMFSAKQSCVWDQTILNSNKQQIQVLPGVYRFEIVYFFNPDDITTKNAYYSPVFEIN